MEPAGRDDGRGQTKVQSELIAQQGNPADVLQSPQSIHISNGNQQHLPLIVDVTL
jgi:hypothetical protein